MRALALPFACLSLTLALAGCGASNAVHVTCEVTKGGKPYVVPDGQVVQVTFYVIDAKDDQGNAIPEREPYAAAPTGDGRYEVRGPDGNGIPPGKYRIAVLQTPKDRKSAPKPKAKNQVPDRDHDFLADRFSPTTSPIVQTVDKPAHVLIDLDAAPALAAPKPQAPGVIND
jgi:hypothetical protein